MEDDIDIYEDLPSFGAKHAEGIPTESTHEVLAREHEELKQQISELTAKLEDFQKTNANLEVNFSSLLKTAKNEIARKDDMIKNLRKELDDALFRRGPKHRKGPCFSDWQPQTDVATVEEPLDYNSHYSENQPPTPEEIYRSDEYMDHQERQQQCDPVPITVFGERLRKKIMDDANAERKERQLNKLISDGDSRESGEVYVAESDKENGIKCNTHSLDLKEDHPCNAERESSVDSGRSKTSSRSIDLHSIDHHHTDAGHRQRSAFAVKYVSKRMNEETTEPISIKRAKIERGVDRLSPMLEEQYLNGYEEENNLSKRTDLRLYSHRLPESVTSTVPKDSVAGHLHTLNGNTKEHRCLDVPGSRRNGERRISREENDSHSSKRHGKSTTRSGSPSDGGNADRRYCEISKYSVRDDHRTKHREDYRSERSCRRADHRSRPKTPPNVKYRDKTCMRRKLDTKHERYDPRERFGKRYDSRSNYGHKLKAVAQKQTYDLRNTIKHLTHDQRAGSAESVDYDRKNHRHERTRMQSVDRSNKHERLKSEIAESNRASSTELEPIKDFRHSAEGNGDRNGPDETRKRVDYYHKHNRHERTRLRSVERAYNRDTTKNDICEKLNRESDFEVKPTRDVRRSAEADCNNPKDLVKQQRSSEAFKLCDQSDSQDKLEDGEIPSSPESSVHNAAKTSQNGRSTSSESRLPSSKKTSQEMTVELKSSQEIIQIDGDRNCENSEMFVDVDPTCSIVFPEHAATLPDAEQQIGNIENVENLDNIEKFIRDYGTDERNLETPSSSQITNKTLTPNKLHVDETEKECNDEPSIDIVKMLNDSTNIDDVSEKPEVEPRSDGPGGDSQTTLPVTLVVDDREPVSKVETNLNIIETPIISTSPDPDVKTTDNRTNGSFDQTSKCSSESSPATTKTDANIMEKPIEEKEHVSENEGVLLLGAMVISREDNDPSMKDMHERSDHHHIVENSFVKSILTETNNESDGVKSTKEDCNRVEELVAGEQKVVSLKTKSEDPVKQSSGVREIEKPTTEKSNVSVRVGQSVKLHGRIILVARRRRPVNLSNSDASMTIVVNGNNTSSNISNTSESNSVLKPRACKVSRIHKNT